MKGKKQKALKEDEKEYNNFIHIIKEPSVHENEKIKVVVSQPQSEENRAMEE
jgi:hypothetical protein